MKWILASNPSSAVHVFNLMEGNTVKEVLRYHPLQRSVRISCMGQQNLFFIEQTGFRNNHFTFKNEYGFDIGKLSVENMNTEGGTIEMEGKKFHYRLALNPTAELVMYEFDQVNPLVSCGFIKKTDHQNQLLHNNKEEIHEYASLLLGLCWYLLVPSLNESSAGYSPAFSLA
ncbi:MAG: hypothetical protein ABJB86_02465 [Bacteroidota bacterium]